MTPTSATTATAKWDPPKKNAEVVELYRILWRAQGSVKAKKVDTSRYILFTRRLVGSTDQADPGCFYFRIS